MKRKALAASMICIALAIPACDGTGPGSPSSTGAPQARPTSATPSPMSVDDYKTQVLALSQRISRDYATVRRHRGYKHLLSKVQALGRDLDDASSTLGGLAAPSDLAAGNQALASALGSLGTAVGSASSSVTALTSCSGTAVASSLGSADANKDVAAAKAQLQGAGIPTKAFVFPQVKLTPTRMHNGAFLIDRRNGARGSLTIENKHSIGAVVTLFNGKTPVISVYVAPKKSTTFSGVPDGVYRAYSQEGSNWDPKEKAFGKDCSFWRSTKPMDFATTTSSSSRIVNEGPYLAQLITTTTYWKVWTLTLGGKSDNHGSKGSKDLTFVSVPPGAFPKNTA